MQLTKPVPFKEAVDKLGRRSPIGSQLTSGEWRNVPLALRERAMFSSTIENVRFLQRAKDSIGDFLTGAREDVILPNGMVTQALKTGGRAQFVEQLRRFALEEGMGDLVDPAKRGTIQDITSERRLGLIFDTQTQAATAYGDWLQGQDSDVLNEFPAWRFIRVRDVDEPRTSHERYEGEVALKNALAVWTRINQDFGVPWGPWGWGCGHDVEDVGRDEAEDLGLVQPGQQLKPAVKAFNDRLAASVRGLDPDLVAHLQRSFGSQVRVRGDTIEWVGTPAASPTPPADPEPLPAPPAPVPRPPAPPDGAPAPRKSPVGKRARLTFKGAAAEKTSRGLKLIDQVHDDGKLSEIPVDSVKQNAYGTFVRGLDGKPVRITVNPQGDHIELTTAHEVGHWLHLEAIGQPGTFEETSRKELAGVLGSIKASDAYQTLLKTADDLREKGQDTHAKWIKKYLLSDHELWARAYAQFIAEESADKAMLDQVAGIIADQPGRQWDGRDFAGVRQAIRRLFTDLGWMP